MRVDTSLLQGISAANLAPKATSAALKSTNTTTSFSSQLKSATEETTKPVPGSNYAEILTGSRAGMYLNTGGGARDGEAFLLVKHGGREDHIYGTGADRTVVTVGKDASETPANTNTKDATSEKTGEKTKPVDGRGFADITTGSRKGLYINTSGNTRDGDAFVLVKREGREYHIYGTGKSREIFSLLDPATKKPSTDTDTSTSTTDKTSTTTDTAPTGPTSPTGSLVTDNPS